MLGQRHDHGETFLLTRRGPAYRPVQEFLHTLCASVRGMDSAAGPTTVVVSGSLPSIQRSSCRHAWTESTTMEPVRRDRVNV